MTANSVKLLLVDDEDDYRRSCGKYMQRNGHVIRLAASGAEAISLLDRESFDVAIFDVDMPGMNGLELMHRVHEEKIDVEVIFLTGKGKIETCVQAMNMGACDFLTKPCSLGDLEHRIQLAHQRRDLRKENQQLRQIVSRSQKIPVLIGQSPVMKDLLRVIDKVAPTKKPVLIEGESGTGKEVVAKLIQHKSGLNDQPFVTINCAALPEQLVESELFGHQKGAFTGATADKPGLFEVADGGTLFIDEIGELPLALQPKLLRVLEDGSLRRIGCHRERRVKVRLIAATNRDLQHEVEQGRFRQDLLYRINVLTLDLPPLRDRNGDLQLLIREFLPKDWAIDDDALEAMQAYHWPGNVRQLINAIERATILADNHIVTLDDLPREILTLPNVDRPAKPPHPEAAASDIHSSDDDSEAISSQIESVSLNNQPLELGDIHVPIDQLLKYHILSVLEKLGGNKAKTARHLGVHRRKLYRLLERYESESRQP